MAGAGKSKLKREGLHEGVESWCSGLHGRVPAKGKGKQVVVALRVHCVPHNALPHGFQPSK